MTVIQGHMEYSIEHWKQVLWSSSYFFHNWHTWHCYEALHMALNLCLMEYSIWHQKVTIWSTPYGNIYSHLDLILKHSIWHQKSATWSTPYGHFLMPYGVLHVVTISCHMEYSMWSLFLTIWSTPCGHYFLPYGVLHVVILEFIFSRGKYQVTSTCNKCKVTSIR